jgi:DNA-3-methyladenine glycosylase I
VSRNAALLAGPDGNPRCWWAVGSADYLEYHDAEWGRPVVADDALFERLCLEAFQTGLSWLTILRKREAFREAFHGFRIDRVAELGEGEVNRLMGEERIVRNRPKIEAALANARAAQRAVEQDGSLAALIWSFAADRPEPPRRRGDMPSTTPESAALARELKRRGFRFVGPTTAYALMQACGIVNDHIDGCVVREAVERERASVRLPAGRG